MRILPLAIALLAAAALAQEKVELQAKYRNGDAYDVRTSKRMALEGAAEGRTVTLSHASVEEYRETILAVENGVPVRAERTYRTSEETREQGGAGTPMKETRKHPIVGRTVTLARKDGKVVLEEKPADCDLAEEDLGIGPDLDVLLPGKPVGAGDRWEVDPQKLATLFDRDAPRKVAGTCTLVRVAVEGGVRLARMQVSVTLEGEEKGTTISAALEGSFVFDVDLGRAVSASWRGRVKMAREKMVLEGPIELEAAITPAG